MRMYAAKQRKIDSFIYFNKGGMYTSKWAEVSKGISLLLEEKNIYSGSMADGCGQIDCPAPSNEEYNYSR